MTPMRRWQRAVAAEWRRSAAKGGSRCNGGTLTLEPGGAATTTGEFRVFFTYCAREADVQRARRDWLSIIQV